MANTQVKPKSSIMAGPLEKLHIHESYLMDIIDMSNT